MRGYSYFNSKKAHKIRACGVSQTPNFNLLDRGVTSSIYHYTNGAYTFITLDSMQVASMVIEDDGYKSVTPLSYGFSTIIYNGYVTADTDGTEIGSTNWLKI